MASMVETIRHEDAQGVQTNPLYREVSEFLCIVAKGKPQDQNAEQVYRWALELWPGNPVALNGLGRIAMERKDYGTACKWFFRATEGNDGPRVLINWSLAERCIPDHAFAREIAEDCVKRFPRFIPAYLQLVSLAQETGTLDDVEAAVDRGLGVAPNDPQLRFALSNVLLAHGDYINGWKEYEYRPSRLDLLEKCDNVQEWRGESLVGKKLLVIGEQGLGDQIMFSRFLHHLPVTAGKFMTRPELARLFGAYACGIVTSDRENIGIDYDYWVGLCSLPLILDKLQVAPLRFEPAQSDINRFAALIPQDGRLRVGLAWKGNPANPADGRRSLTFEQIEPLLDVPGCAFYSLQYGERVDDPRIVDIISHCHDLADQAAAMMNLDLIITCDSAPLHLAGSLGRPCWGMIHEVSDWRWGDNKETTPWYPSVQLIRQRHPCDWTGVIAETVARLDVLAPAERPKASIASVPKADPIARKPTRYGTMSYLKSDHYIGRALDLYGEYSESEASLLRDLLKPGDVVVEAGANIGALTLPIAQAIAPDGEVFAFEPQPEYFELLQQNCDYDGQHLINRGLARESEIIRLPAIPMEAIHAPGWTHNLQTDEHEMEVMALDELNLSRMDLIKIDIDGGEHLALLGAKETIANHRPLLFVENDKPEAYPDLVRWLIEDAGYKLWQHFAPLYNPDNFAGYKVNVFGNTVSAMLLCVPKEWMLDQAIIDKHGLQRVRTRKVAA